MQLSQSGTRIEASTADYLLTDWVYWCGDAYLVRSTSTNWWQFLATAWRPLSVTRLHPLRLRCVSCAHIEASLYSGVSVTCTFQYRDSLCRLGLCEFAPMSLPCEGSYTTTANSIHILMQDSASILRWCWKWCCKHHAYRLYKWAQYRSLKNAWGWASPLTGI